MSLQEIEKKLLREMGRGADDAARCLARQIRSGSALAAAMAVHFHKDHGCPKGAVIRCAARGVVMAIRGTQAEAGGLQGAG